jgi:hypothetical protein
MKIILLNIFFILVLIGCSPKEDSVNTETTINDPVRIELFNSLSKEISSLKVDLEKTCDENSTLLSQVDTLQIFVIKFQGDAIKLVEARKKLTKFTEMNKDFLDKISDLKNKNLELEIANDSINTALSKESEKNKSFKKLNKLIPTLLTVKGYYYSKKLFGKPKLLETLDAKSIQYIEVSFTFGTSDVVPQKDYTTVTTIYDKTGSSSISKTLIFSYTGEEKTCTVVFPNDTIRFDKGLHKVVLKVDSKTYNKSISLK